MASIKNQCIGCGYCCKKVRCSLSVFLAGEGDFECPFLYWDDDRYKCALVVHPDYAAELHIGEGCSSSLNSIRQQLLLNFGKYRIKEKEESR